MLYEVADEAIVQIGAHQISTGWRGMSVRRDQEVRGERHRPAADCSEEVVLCIFDDVQ